MNLNPNRRGLLISGAAIASIPVVSRLAQGTVLSSRLRG